MYLDDQHRVAELMPHVTALDRLVVRPPQERLVDATAPEPEVARGRLVESGDEGVDSAYGASVVNREAGPVVCGPYKSVGPDRALQRSYHRGADGDHSGRSIDSGGGGIPDLEPFLVEMMLGVEIVFLERAQPGVEQDLGSVYARGAQRREQLPAEGTSSGRHLSGARPAGVDVLVEVERDGVGHVGAADRLAECLDLFQTLTADRQPPHQPDVRPRAHDPSRH